ncbi:MAG: hypothetical protein HY742_03665 [Deltaproteobacteria bacterium]|nr:hypothetical protein [Deltaproteobacteria bacterium]
MSFDYYASLDEKRTCPREVNECGLAAGFVAECTVWSCQCNPQDQKAPDPKNEARKLYINRAAKLELKLPRELRIEPELAHLPNPSWFGIDISFILETPWYSKDDRPFHLLDNPVRKDRIFGIPFMSAASWKGLLRWAYGMNAGLVGACKELDSGKIKKAKEQIVHLFGNEKDEQKKFRSGALVFYPTWFDKIGFEVINPHSRKTRAGTIPIYYEVVPAGREGRFRLLYAPLPGEIEKDKVKAADFIDNLIDAITALLETYGISAKRTVGWGTARIKTWTGFVKAGSFAPNTVEEFRKEIKNRIAQSKGGGQ